MAQVLGNDELAEYVREGLKTRPQWRIKSSLSGVLLQHANFFMVKVWEKDGNLRLFPVQTPYVLDEVYAVIIPLADPNCIEELGRKLDSIMGLYYSRK